MCVWCCALMFLQAQEWMKAWIKACWEIGKESFYFPSYSKTVIQQTPGKIFQPATERREGWRREEKAASTGRSYHWGHGPAPLRWPCISASVHTTRLEISRKKSKHGIWQTEREEEGEREKGFSRWIGICVEKYSHRKKHENQAAVILFKNLCKSHGGEQWPARKFSI